MEVFCHCPLDAAAAAPGFRCKRRRRSQFSSAGLRFCREREREARKTPTVDGNFLGFLDESILPNVELSFVKATAFSDQETVPRSVICLCCRRSAPIQVRTAALEGPHHHFWALFGHPTPPAENRTLVCHCQGQPPLFLDQKCVWKS